MLHAGDINFCLVISYNLQDFIYLAPRAQLTSVVRYGPISSYCLSITKSFSIHSDEKHSKLRNFGTFRILLKVKKTNQINVCSTYSQKKLKALLRVITQESL